MQKKVAIIIVNYQTPDLVINCLNTLRSELENTNAKVVIVDNASGDNSAALVTDWISVHNTGSKFLLICSELNAGFAAGNNIAIKRLRAANFNADFFWLLNPDTLVRADALEPLLAFMAHNPGAGIVGSKIEDAQGNAQSSAFRFHSIISEFENGLKLGIISWMLQKWLVALPASDIPMQVDWVSGASMLIRKEVLEQVGLFDERYFLYFEETDFCFQAKKAGWSCWHVPASTIIHYEGSSTGVANHSKKRRPRYWFESRRRYFLKNHGRLYLFLANLAWASAFALYRIRQKIQAKPDNESECLWRDFVKFNFASQLINFDKA